MSNARPIHIGGEPRRSGRTAAVADKYTGATLAEVSVAGRAEVDEAIGVAAGARRAMAALPISARRDALLEIARALGQRREEFAGVLVAEVGKPISLARGEVDRAIDTFTLSAQEASRLTGDVLPLGGGAPGAGTVGLTRRAPIGVCSFITPFNFPLNLAAHKIGPAIAAGCPWVLKPDDRTPITSLLLAEVLAGLDLPGGAFSVLPCPDDGRELFSEDDRLSLLSFTGSPVVGWALRARAGRKRVVLELGGNAACIVDEGARVDHVAERIAAGAFAQAGQSCISVQRVLAHESVYAPLRDGLIERAKEMDAVRGAHDESALLGPLIDERSALRVQEWVGEAVDAGARVIVGGAREGAWFTPTILENTPRTARVSRQEVFGPVMTIEPFEDFDEAISIADDSEWGLQAGVFTDRLDRAWRAFDRLEVGGVIVNDIPTARSDAAPYGGVKGSGVGREGPRYAIRDMTELRLMVLTRPDGG